MMDFTPEMISSIGGLLLIMGGGIRFLMLRQDKKEMALKEEQDREREKLETLLQTQIDQLRRENQILREDVARYVRHVGVLEGILRHAGIDIPGMN